MKGQTFMAMKRREGETKDGDKKMDCSNSGSQVCVYKRILVEYSPAQSLAGALSRLSCCAGCRLAVNREEFSGASRKGIGEAWLKVRRLYDDVKREYEGF